MSEITSAGYQDLRNYIQDNWAYIELRDDQGAAIVRLPVTDDRRNVCADIFKYGGAL